MAELGCWGWTKSRWQLQHGKKSSRNLKIRAGLGYEKFRACIMYLDRLKTFPSQEMEGRDCATLKITRELAMRRRSWLTIMCFDRPKEINLTLMWGVRRWKFSKKNQEYLVRWFGWERECCQIRDKKTEIGPAMGLYFWITLRKTFSVADFKKRIPCFHGKALWIETKTYV